jgi:7-cyano-7-deazaguanine synthase
MSTTPETPTRALVIFSGGQDSTTCLAIAKAEFDEVHTISFNYGQRHLTEIQSAGQIAALVGVASHEIINLGSGILAGTSPLITANPVGQYESIEQLPTGVEPTFVPGRNALFLTIAANRAACLGIIDIFTGVCESDYAGYWDCRQIYIDAQAIALSQAIHGVPDIFTIHTPLMQLSKSDSVLLALDLMGDQFDSVMELTQTCYNGVKGGCGKCHACLLRDRGFTQAGVSDPIWKYREGN